MLTPFFLIPYGGCVWLPYLNKLLKGFSAFPCRPLKAGWAARPAPAWPRPGRGQRARYLWLANFLFKGSCTSCHRPPSQPPSPFYRKGRKYKITRFRWSWAFKCSLVVLHHKIKNYNHTYYFYISIGDNMDKHQKSNLKGLLKMTKQIYKKRRYIPKAMAAVTVIILITE